MAGTQALTYSLQPAPFYFPHCWQSSCLSLSAEITGGCHQRKQMSQLECPPICRKDLITGLAIGSASHHGPRQPLAMSWSALLEVSLQCGIPETVSTCIQNQGR